MDSPGHIEITTCQRKDGLWQFVCTICKNCGGNYQTEDFALAIGNIHARQIHSR